MCVCVCLEAAAGLLLLLQPARRLAGLLELDERTRTSSPTTLPRRQRRRRLVGAATTAFEPRPDQAARQM